MLWRGSQGNTEAGCVQTRPRLCVLQVQPRGNPSVANPKPTIRPRHQQKAFKAIGTDKHRGLTTLVAARTAVHCWEWKRMGLSQTQRRSQASSTTYKKQSLRAPEYNTNVQDHVSGGWLHWLLFDPKMRTGVGSGGMLARLKIG